MKILWIASISLCLLAARTFAEEDRLLTTRGNSSVIFSIDAKPFGILTSPHIDKISLKRYSMTSYGWVREREQVSSIMSLTPGVNVGLRVDSEVAFLDMNLGGGYLWNDAFDAHYGTFQTRARFRLGRADFGPHLGIIRIRGIDWSGDADVKFGDVNGSFFGLGLNAGSQAAQFHLSVDWLAAAKGSVRTRNNWFVTRDSSGKLSQASNRGKYDLSGLRVEVGVTFNL